MLFCVIEAVPHFFRLLPCVCCHFADGSGQGRQHGGNWMHPALLPWGSTGCPEQSALKYRKVYT